MTEHTTTVSLDGNSKDVVYDDETDEWSFRRPLSDIRRDIADRKLQTNDDNTVGRVIFDEDAYREFADRRGDAVATVAVELQSLVDWAEAVEEAAVGRKVEVTASEALPLVAELVGDEAVLLAPIVSRDESGYEDNL